MGGGTPGGVGLGESRIVKDIRVGHRSSSPQGIVAASDLGLLFFSADDGSNGRELWVSDGDLDDASGTVMVKNINSGSGSSSPTGMTPDGTGSLVYFSANDGSSNKDSS